MHGVNMKYCLEEGVVELATLTMSDVHGFTDFTVMVRICRNSVSD